MQDLTDNPDIDANDYVMAKNLAETLHGHYPGHAWAVTCEGRQGVITIRNLRLSGQMGYVIKLPSMYSISALLKQVMMAGGELLERYRLSPSKFDMDRYSDLALDTAGRPLFQV